MATAAHTGVNSEFVRDTEPFRRELIAGRRVTRGRPSHSGCSGLPVYGSAAEHCVTLPIRIQGFRVKDGR